VGAGLDLAGRAAAGSRSGHAPWQAPTQQQQPHGSGSLGAVLRGRAPRASLGSRAHPPTPSAACPLPGRARLPPLPRAPRCPTQGWAALVELACRVVRGDLPGLPPLMVANLYSDRATSLAVCRTCCVAQVRALHHWAGLCTSAHTQARVHRHAYSTCHHTQLGGCRPTRRSLRLSRAPPPLLPLCPCLAQAAMRCGALRLALVSLGQDAAGVGAELAELLAAPPPAGRCGLLSQDQLRQLLRLEADTLVQDLRNKQQRHTSTAVVA
jgi:hypothetical protein